MKRLLFTALAVVATFSLTLAQQNRASPHEKETGTVNGKNITIEYGRPSVKGRNVFDASGQIAPYGKVWRTGADESTTFTVDKEVKVEGKSLPAGKYALFTIPGEKEWTIIFNKTPKWGAYTYKQDEDVLRVTVPAKKNASPVEQFTIDVMNNGTVALMWADARAEFKVN